MEIIKETTMIDIAMFDVNEVGAVFLIKAGKTCLIDSGSKKDTSNIIKALKSLENKRAINNKQIKDAEVVEDSSGDLVRVINKSKQNRLVSEVWNKRVDNKIAKIVAEDGEAYAIKILMAMYNGLKGKVTTTLVQYINGIMKNITKKAMIFITLMILLIVSPEAQTGSKENHEKIRLPENVYIELTREFYEAMKNKEHGGQMVYSNDPSLEYLREISVSSRFIVETNLQILKQQERIISLLQILTEKKSK